MMKRMTAVLTALLLVTSALVGCSNAGSGGSNMSATGDIDTGDGGAGSVTGMDGEGGETGVADWAGSAETAAAQTAKDMFTDRDFRAEYEENKSVLIELTGTSAKASADSVIIADNTITITEEATYIISGTLADGMILVDAPDTAKLQIVLNGVDITAQTSAPLYILEADKVFLTLAAGTENILSNGGEFTAIDENNIDGAIFSKQDLTINGAGSLTVISPAGHGIVCKDDLVITGGTYIVQAASHGLDANDSVRIAGETSLTIAAGKDGIRCENSDDDSLGFIYVSNAAVTIEAEGDGLSAGAYVQIEGGQFDLLAGGGSENGSRASSGGYGSFPGGGFPGGGRGGDGHGSAGMRPGGGAAGTGSDMGAGGDMSLVGDAGTTMTEDASTSMKGIKAAGTILINGGSFTIDSADDAVHSDCSITINGGTFDIASGDDAVHAEDTLTITAGTINISRSYEGLEALHIDVQGGDIRLTADDDGLNSAGGNDLSGMTGGRDGLFGGGKGGPGGGMSSGNGSIVISGGNLYVRASGDGIDANGTLEISGGYTVVVGPTQGDTATLDYDKSAVITGGTFIGTGASGMAQTFSDSDQGVVAIRVGNQSAGTSILLKDKDGKTLIEYAPELDFSVVILSSPELVKGETYTIEVGEASGEFEAG